MKFALALLALLSFAVPAGQQGQGCSGHGDTRPGCAADPAPWVCARKAHGKDVVACACKLQCDEDQNQSESSDCVRYCAKKNCTCHIEETCPDGVDK